MEELRYTFNTINEGRKEKSEKIIKDMCSLEDKEQLFLDNFKGLTVDKFATIQGKTGIVRKIMLIGKRLFVWLEIVLTREYRITSMYTPVVIHYGIELKIH